MPADPQAGASQWEGSSTETPTFFSAYLISSGGGYALDDTGPETASLVYSGGTLQVDSDPNAANRVSILHSPAGGALTLLTG